MKKLFLLFTLAFMALSCEEAQDFIDEKGHGLVFLEGEMKAYFDDKGDTKNYKFQADLAWSAAVSADWVEVDPTRGPAGENKIKIKVDKNKSDEKRTGYVDITLSNEKSYRIELEQLASGENLDDIIEPTTPIPNNEIWYTSTDGEIVEPNDPMAFNVSIKSNIYEDGKGVITFDGEVTEVGEMAFYGCDNCTTNCYNLTSFILPQSVTSIGNHAFDGCRNLQSVTISDNVTHIGEAAFICCAGLKEFNSKYASEDGRCLIIDGTLNSFAPAGLTEYTIPDSVTTIGGGVFYNCTKLQSITWGKGVKTVGGSAFNNCTSLNAVHISDLAAWCDIDFIISTGTENPLYYARNLYLDGDLVTDLVIPESITAIKQLAFFYCGSIKSLTIHDNLTSIGHYAFQNCDGMESVTIGDSVTSIGDSAFRSCSSLTSVTIPDSVTTIGDYAFAYCSSLTSVTMGKGIETVGGYAFSNCSSLNAVHISDLASWCNIDFVNPISNGFSLVANPLVYACNLYLNGGLITELVIPESVTEIKFLTFTGCSASNIVFHDNIKSIGPCAFSRCENIENLVIGNGVEYIGNVAFGRCPKLTSVTMSENIASYGYNVFLECYNLVEFKGVYATEDGRALAVNNILLVYANASGSEYTIPDGITAIYQGAFFNCVNLRSVTIPESVTGIGYMAFGYNSNLESVYCKPTTPPSTDMYAFQYPNEDGEYVNAPCKIYVPQESYDAYMSKGGWANYSDNLVGYNFETGEVFDPESFECVIKYTSTDGEIVVPCDSSAFDAEILCNIYKNGTGMLCFDRDVTTIGDEAFERCESLTSVTIPDSVTTIGDSAFSWCKGLTSVTIPDSVTTIGYEAFSYCRSLTSVTIPDSVTTIGWHAFAVCSSLTSITIPDSVTEIGGYAFWNCSSLTTVTIGDSVTTIENGAFSSCSSLTSVYCKAIRRPAGGYDMFSGNASGRKIYVLTESVEVYKSAKYWSDYADAIVGYNF